MRIVQRVNKHAKERSQIYYLLLDGCSSHVAAAKIMDPTGSFDDNYYFENDVLRFTRKPGSK